jgi:hypothetical protein
MRGCRSGQAAEDLCVLAEEPVLPGGIALVPLLKSGEG